MCRNVDGRDARGKCVEGEEGRDWIGRAEKGFGVVIHNRIPFLGT